MDLESIICIMAACLYDGEPSAVPRPNEAIKFEKAIATAIRLRRHYLDTARERD